MNIETVIGMDLAVKAENPTGWALWKNKHVQTGPVYTNSESLARIARHKPSIVAIDASLSLPK